MGFLATFAWNRGLRRSRLTSACRPRGLRLSASSQAGKRATIQRLLSLGLVNPEDERDGQPCGVFLEVALLPILEVRDRSRRERRTRDTGAEEGAVCVSKACRCMSGQEGQTDSSQSSQLVREGRFGVGTGHAALSRPDVLRHRCDVVCALGPLRELEEISTVDPGSVSFRRAGDWRGPIDGFGFSADPRVDHDARFESEHAGIDVAYGLDDGDEFVEVLQFAPGVFARGRFEGGEPVQLEEGVS